MSPVKSSISFGRSVELRDCAACRSVHHMVLRALQINLNLIFLNKVTAWAKLNSDSERDSLPINGILILLVEVIRVPDQCGNPLCGAHGLVSSICNSAGEDVTNGTDFRILQTAL